MNQARNLLAALLLGMLSLGASAQVSGTIGQVQVGDGGIFVTLAPAATMCPGGSSIFFLPTSNTNYAGYSHWIAKAQGFGQTVTVYSAFSGGYCTLNWLMVAP